MADQLRALVAGAGDTGDPGPQWRRELQRTWRLAEGLEPYIASCTTPESDTLRAVRRRTEQQTDLEREMLSGHVQGQLLRFLVRSTRASRVLEIGMFTGYSALAMAEALPEDGVLLACEIDADVAELARRSFADTPSGGRIEVREGPALDTLADLAAAGASFDLVFLDAEKSGYLGYLDALLDTAVLAPDGVVCVDNTLLQGEPWLEEAPSANGAAIADFNRAVAEDPRVEQVLVPLRDGLTLIRRAQHH